MFCFPIALSWTGGYIGTQAGYGWSDNSEVCKADVHIHPLTGPLRSGLLQLTATDPNRGISIAGSHLRTDQPVAGRATSVRFLFKNDEGVMNIASNKVIGAWEVYAPDAPFAWHVMSFLPGGIVLQSNPHEGNRQQSDSSGHGVWQLREWSSERAIVVAKFVEFKADRQTGKYLGRGVIRLEFTLDEDSFSGTAAAFWYGADNQQIDGPQFTPIRGRRIALSADDLLPLG